MKVRANKVHFLAVQILKTNRGYSINNEKYIAGLFCIGAPLMNFREKTIVGAVSLDFPTS
ncbi:MAG TPA: hypothetical protein ENI07_06840 [Desulfobacterales bacterium]|nr:hypothetical protein [Desulfobacterales bacterium]